MQIRGHGTAVAVVLSVLALAVAGGGTAVAVSSAVNIVDPTTPSRIAKVDAGGHLSVAGSVSTIDSTGYVFGYADRTFTTVISPTTATIAISRLQVSNPSANAGATEQQLAFGRYPATAGGSCQTDQTPTLLARFNVAPGDDIDDPLPAPLVVAPIRGAAYCIAIAIIYLGDATATPDFYLNYGITAYVTAGAYTGLGAPGTTPIRPKGSAKIGG